MDNRDIYKKLVHAYYNSDNFCSEVNKIIINDFSDINEAKKTILSLCGVEIYEDNNFTYSLAKAITMKEVKTDIVTKVKKCEKTCTAEGKSAKCVSVCPFNAIKECINSKDKIIDYNLCAGCGLCISACNSNNYLDTKQGLPLLEILKSNKNVIACVAPAISGQFGDNVSLDKLRGALIQL